jgi:hypothetical protein
MPSIPTRLYCLSEQQKHGPHLWRPKPGFNPGFTPHICYIKGGITPGWARGLVSCDVSSGLPYFINTLVKFSNNSEQLLESLLTFIHKACHPFPPYSIQRKQVYIASLINFLSNLEQQLESCYTFVNKACHPLPLDPVSEQQTVLESCNLG